MRTLALSTSLSSHASADDDEGGTYTVVGTVTPVAGSVTAVFIQNNDTSFVLVLDRVIIQAVVTGGTVLPNSTAVHGIAGFPTGAIFTMGFGRTGTAGTSVTPTNLNRTSTKIANVTTLVSNPTMAGTFVESHRQFALGSGTPFELLSTRTNDVILGRSNTLEVRYLSDNTGGTVTIVVKFMMIRISDVS